MARTTLMAPPTVSVSPATHSTTGSITLTGGPFGVAQGKGFVFVINDHAEIVEMTIESWADATITAAYPPEYAPLRTFTEQWRVVVDGETTAGQTTSTFQGVPPASAALASGDPVYVASSEIRAEQQSFARGYVVAESAGLYQVQLLDTDLSFGTTVVPAASISPMGRLSESYLQKQDRLPSVGLLLVWSAGVSLGSDVNPSTEGADVTFTVAIFWNPVDFINPVPPPPTGSIEFSNEGVLMATVALTPSGPSASSAVFTTASLPIGTTTITASYAGDTVYSTAFATLEQTVNGVG